MLIPYVVQMASQSGSGGSEGYASKATSSLSTDMVKNLNLDPYDEDQVSQSLSVLPLFRHFRQCLEEKSMCVK